MLRASARCSRESWTALDCSVGEDVEGHLDDAVLDVVRDLVAGLLEDREHLAVLRKHLGGEPGDADLLRDGGQVLEHDGADALALDSGPRC